jgi:hypothetical protein
MKQENLNTLKDKLTEQDVDEIVSIVGHRCRIKTVNRLRSILTYSASTLAPYGIYSRLMKENGRWFYCAGQSYTDEIKTLRECILGKIF